METERKMKKIYTIERVFLSKVSPEDVVSKIIQTIVLAKDSAMHYNGAVDMAFEGDRYEK